MFDQNSKDIPFDPSVPVPSAPTAYSPPPDHLHDDSTAYDIRSCSDSHI